MQSPDLTYGPEWAILELLCLGLTTPDEQEAFADLVRLDCLQWKVLLEQAVHHKMLPMLAFHISSAKLGEDLAGPTWLHLRLELRRNRRLTEIYRDAAAQIVRALDEQGVQFVGRKGIIFESTLYGKSGSRRLGDVDFMITPEDRDSVKNIMSQLGYQMGTYDLQISEVIPHSRRKMLAFWLNPDHIPTFVRPTGDSDVPCVVVDFANSLTWTGSPYAIPVEVALGSITRQPIPGFSGVEMPCFSPAFQFIDTVLHLFREAWIGEYENPEKDVALMQFGDIIRLWQANREILRSESFVRTLNEFGIVKPVVWVLEHLDRVFHTSIVPSLGLQGQATEKWLFSARVSGGQLWQWGGTMRERLQRRNRRAMFACPIAEFDLR